MKLEDRLHDAMRDYADTIEPEPGSWSKIESRFDDAPVSHRPSRRPLVLASAAIVLVVVLITALVLRDDGGDTHVVTGPPDASPAPSRILTINDAGQPVMLETATGKHLNALDTIGTAGEYAVAVTPDGADAYAAKNDGDCNASSIQRVPLGPGARPGEAVATNAMNPAVSPDGRLLAYLRCGSGDGASAAIVVRDLMTGTEQVRVSPTGRFLTGLLTFAPDSRHVLVRYIADPIGRGSLYELDVVGGEAAPGREIAVNRAIFIVGYLGRSGALYGYDDQRSPPAVVELSRTTGAVTRTLVATSGIPGAVSRVAPDASGRHLLIVVDGNQMYRWNDGDEGLTRVADGVRTAAWIPDTESDEPRPNTGRDPIGVLIAHRDGELTLVGAQDHAKLSSLGTYRDLSSVSATPDGRQIIFQASAPSGACGDNLGPNVVRHFPARDATIELVGGAISPVVSSDGTLVAYGTWCDGRTLGFTNIASGGNSRTNPLGGTENEQAPNVETVEPLGWSPDSTRLLYRLGLKEDQDPHYYVGRLWPAVPLPATEVIELENTGNVTAAAFLDDDTLALARTSGSRSEVTTWPAVDTRSMRPRAELLFEVPDRVISLVGDRSGKHFLAVTRGGDLYRWRRGDAEPEKLAGDVTAAAWLPDTASVFSYRSGADANLPSDFPSEVPSPAEGPLRSIVSESDPPNVSYTMTYRLDGRDAIEAGNRYRNRLQRAGLEIRRYGSVGGGDGEAVEFEGIGKRWDVTVVAGRQDPRDPPTLLVQVRTHGRVAHDIPGAASTTLGGTGTAG